jgi:co-chaperonin GroES (HSP10)
MVKDMYARVFRGLGADQQPVYRRVQGVEVRDSEAKSYYIDPNQARVKHKRTSLVAVCAVGKSIEDNGRTVTVKAIDGGVVTIEYAGQTQKLEVRGP